MSHTIRDKQKLKARASKIQGQVVALKKMLSTSRTNALQFYNRLLLSVAR